MAPTTEEYRRVTDYYRRAMDGHVYIRETIEALLEEVDNRMRLLGRTPRILELGSHAGITTEWLLQRWPHAEIVVHDEDDALVAMARQRLAGRRVEYCTRPLDTMMPPFDLAISIARHHHLPHHYLAGLRRVIKPDGVYVLADELCPEYCEGEDAERVERAEVIHIVGGYVLTSHSDVAAFEENGTFAPHAVEREQLRRRALWRWYRFVVDQCVERGYFDVAVGELQSAHDDLITGSDAEHKFSPRIVERQFALAGFRRLSKRLIGPPGDPERQSMFVYGYGLC